MTPAVMRERGDKLLSGNRGSVSGVLVCWSLDLGSTPDGSLSFSFPLDHLGLCMFQFFRTWGPQDFVSTARQTT